MEPMERKLIVIRGPSSVGKTSVGEELAKRLGYGFIDEDEVRHTFSGKNLTDESFDFAIRKIIGLTKYGNFVVAGAFIKSKRLKLLFPTSVYRLSAKTATLYRRNRLRGEKHLMPESRISYLQNSIEDYPNEILVNTESKPVGKVVDEICKSHA